MGEPRYFLRPLPFDETTAWLRAHYYAASDADLEARFPGFGVHAVDRQASRLGLWPQRRRSVAMARALGLELAPLPEGTVLWRHTTDNRADQVLVVWDGGGALVRVEALASGAFAWVHRARLSTERRGPRLL